ncbi:hypothetical protein CYMTET_18123, partial [Cymbomonas tetramitiformis]
WHLEYNAALSSINFMLFLGFVDDVLDIPWRYKLTLPVVASLPLLVSYSGGTAVVIPNFLRASVHLEYAWAAPIKTLLPFLSIHKGILELGALYYGYMLALTVFCSNSINILAGVNGLEAGQTFVIACSVLALNLTMLDTADIPLRDAHLFSVFMMIPLIATTFALLRYNWYPSQCFVGDTFTYFAGMTLAVAGILGHFSETLLLFFIPQVFNFLYSVPQLFKIVHCPRHRLPKLDPDTGLLHPTFNMNLVNLTLRVTGPMKEEHLTVCLLVFQMLCCGAGLAIRHVLPELYTIQ